MASSIGSSDQFVDARLYRRASNHKLSTAQTCAQWRRQCPPIALRLTHAELERVKEGAERDQRSMASVCRMAVLRELGMNDNGSQHMKLRQIPQPEPRTSTCAGAQVGRNCCQMEQARQHDLPRLIRCQNKGRDS